MSALRMDVECRFQRPVDVVRAHFVDMRHHIEHGVHHGVHYTILEEQPGRQRVRQSFRVLGLKKTDEMWLYVGKDGVVVQDFIAGDFKGGRLSLELRADGDGTAAVAHFDFPLRGMNRVIAPILRRVVHKLAVEALEEDRVDLEVKQYQPSTTARAAAAI